MAYNYKKASEGKYPIQVNGKMMELSGEQIAHVIKKKMREDIAVQKLFAKFEVSIDQLNDLNITIEDLSGRFAETDLDGLVLDKGLFDDGQFFAKNYFICIHELVHYLSRHKEEVAYFNDPEEVLGFIGSVASLLADGSNMDEIWTLVYPKISFHFNSEEDSRKFMVHCIYKAKELLS